MIYNVKIENFFSIADRQELALAVPNNAPNLPCFILSPSEKESRLPTVVGIFGANASGKSWVLGAIFSIAAFMIASLKWENNDLREAFQPYKQKIWLKKPTIIMIEFDSRLMPNEPLAKFRYEIHISHQSDALTETKVSYEALSYAPQGKFRNLFERHDQTFSFGKDFKISDKDRLRERVRPNASTISTFAMFNHQPSLELCKRINAIQTNLPTFERRLHPTEWLSVYERDKACLDRLNKELRRFDVGLEEMTVEKHGQMPFAKFKHVGLDDYISLSGESSGTKRFIEMFILLHYALEQGSIAIIDEIDLALHPLLLPELLRWFSNAERNPKGAQLFFTAHNPALLDELEKDQVFFTEKLYGKPTCIYGASDIKGLRREPSLMKKYLAGELGAIPHIG